MLSASDKKEIREIVQDEIKKRLDKEFDERLQKSIKNGLAKKEIVQIIKNSLVDYAKFMWTKRTTWQHEIKG